MYLTSLHCRVKLGAEGFNCQLFFVVRLTNKELELETSRITKQLVVIIIISYFNGDKASASMCVCVCVCVCVYV